MDDRSAFVIKCKKTYMNKNVNMHSVKKWNTMSHSSVASSFNKFLANKDLKKNKESQLLKSFHVRRISSFTSNNSWTANHLSEYKYPKIMTYGLRN